MPGGGAPEDPARRLALLQGAAALGAVAPAAAAAAEDPLAFWRSAPRGLNIGILRRARHDRGFLDAVAMTGARLGRLFVDFVWVPQVRRYLLPLETQQMVGEVLGHAERAGLALVLVGDFETPPNPPLWGDATRAAAFAEGWRFLARLARGAPALAGHDLFNEPNPPWSDGTDAPARREWRALAERTIAAVRSEDPLTPIVMQGIAGGSSLGLRGVRPFADRRMVYSLHFYSPHPITHQHVSARFAKTIPYPVDDEAVLQGTEAAPGPWDAARLRREMADARAFQLAHGFPVFAGEFSCVRWAPDGSALRWLRDVLALFDEYRWSWAYHEFRGWPGWDAEVVAEDRWSQQRVPDAPAMQLLRREMARTR